MNIKLKCLLVFFLLFEAQNICAQTQIRAGFLPSVNYNQKINKLYEVNFRLESRHFVFENNSFQSNHFNYEYSLTDVSALMARKVGLNSKLVVGFLARTEPNAVSVRSIQQFIFQSKINNFRVAHRIVTDQTFSPKESPEFRLRYRLSAEIPLSGIKVDAKEFYFKFNTEALNGVQNKVYDLELRAVPNLGYVINERHKIELGLDNRFVSFIDNQTRITSWIIINWFL